MCSLSYVHVYRIEYVSYRQGPYWKRIVSADDRIVPALVMKVFFCCFRQACIFSSSILKALILIPSVDTIVPHLQMQNIIIVV